MYKFVENTQTKNRKEKKMKKVIKMTIFLFLLTIVLPLTANADSTVTVNNQDELKNAIDNKDVTTIELGSDINTTEKITVSRTVTIDGNGHTMKYVGSVDKKVWGGIYLLQFYKTNATLKDITLTGGNAAILVNGSTLTLVGKINVSGNGFGGIELSQGKNVEDTSKLILADDFYIINDDETADTPSFWVPSDSKDAIITLNGIDKIITKGDEVSLSEFEELFPGDQADNPATSDKLPIYLISEIAGLIGFTLILRKLTKEA